MGLEHNYYLLPKPNSFLPQPSQVISFLTELESEQCLRAPYTGWIASSQGARIRRDPLQLAEAGAAIERRWDSGIRVSWPLWLTASDPAFNLEVHVSQDYVYHVSESVNSFGETVDCAGCGTRLDFEPQDVLFDIRAIRRTCPRCGTVFDPSQWPATYVDGWTGEKTALLGGATYRFALIVGNVPAEEQEHFTVGADFLRLFYKVFGCEARAFPDFS